MAQLSEAVARYHKLLDSKIYRDLQWAEALQERMREQKLEASGRLVAPVLRPHFISRRQHEALVQAAEDLATVLNHVEALALKSPILMARMQMLPAEKMLAAIDPGYSHFSVTSLLDANLQNGSLQFRSFLANTPAGVAYSESLSTLFLETPLVREFRQKYKLGKLGGSKYLLASLLKAYREFGGNGKKKPNIAIVELKQQFSPDSNESLLLAKLFEEGGYSTRTVSPENLEYRNGVLSDGDFQIDVVFRRLRTQELLVHYDLSHPLLRAYRDRAVCVVNSFRSELAQRLSLFDLLSDEKVLSTVPTAARKAIHELIPWTRVVFPRKTKYHDKVVDLLEFILKNREKLVLRPNENGTNQQSFTGAELDQQAWERALKQALRAPYVVQEAVAQVRQVFPLYQYGELQMKEVEVSVQPHNFLGKVQGASAILSTAVNGFASQVALVPVFVLESA